MLRVFALYLMNSSISNHFIQLIYIYSCSDIKYKFCMQNNNIIYTLFKDPFKRGKSRQATSLS